MSENKVEHLYADYVEPFASFDDVTLARWLSQTLSQLQGKFWRMSHPLINTYRFAAKVGQERQIWLKRLANTPPGYAPSNCCRAPFFAIFSRDLLKSGFVCIHCEETALEFDDLPVELKDKIRPWLEKYAQAHAVAHWTQDEQEQALDYNNDLEDARKTVTRYLNRLEGTILPDLQDVIPTFAWEDQDECLDIAPEDIKGKE